MKEIPTNLSTFKYFIQNKFLLTVFLVFIFLLHIKSQETDLHFSHITTNEGLSNNFITCINQDKMGFMWFGTDEGLNRYDGYSVKVFKKILGDSLSIADNIIYDICTDYLDNIWVGTQNGICYFNYDKENFSTYILDPKRLNINTANRVTSIKVGPDKSLYASTEIGFIYKFNEKNKIFEKASSQVKNITCFIVDDQNNFWAGGTSGLYYINNKNGHIQHFDSINLNTKKVSIGEVSTIMEEGDTIWIGTIKGKIYNVFKKTMLFKRFEYDFGNPYYIDNIVKARNKLYYISTTDGFFVYNKDSKQCMSYKFQQNNPGGLNGLGIKIIFEDKQGNIWVGTAQDGINLATHGKLFHNLNLFSKYISLDIVNIHSIIEDDKHNLWLGSFTNGINVINTDTKQKKLFLHNDNDPESLAYGSVYSIFQDSKKNIWVGVYLGFLQKYNTATNSFISYPFNPAKGEYSDGHDIRSIIEDDKGYLWIASAGFGFSKFDPITAKFKHYRRDYTTHKPTLPDDYVFQLLYDHNKKIWLATPSGLSKFDPETETYINYYHNSNDSNSLCNNFITALFEDSNHHLWIGTTFGLDLFDEQKQSFVHFHIKNGLPSDKIKSILENIPGELWIGTSYGLSCLKYKFNSISHNLIAHFRNYNKSDNLQDNQFWERSAYKTKYGQLIFGGESGIVLFKPDEIVDNTTIPDVYITGIKLFNKPLEIGQFDSILKKNIIKTKYITLKYNQNIFSFEFVAINYIANNNNNYAYKMEGFDKDWDYVGNKHEVTYTNLDPGEYTFKVKASNNDGYWNNKGAAIKLTILPPFWATWWFRLLIILIIISLILSFYWNRVSFLKNQNVKLEKKIDERTIELTEKNNWILAQNEEITSQNVEIFNKNEEILQQKELLEEQKSKIEIAYNELSQYRNKLEELVEERTKELIIAKEKAEESDKLKSSFLANLSHEIRTPLNSIIGFSFLICDPLIQQEEKLNFKSIIERSSNNLLNLINDIIDFSKIEAGYLEIVYKRIPLINILNYVEQIFELEIKKQQFERISNLDFRLNIDENVKQLIIETDEIRVTQILTNLISNAIKFTEKGYIEVGCKLNNGENSIEFYIKDTGIGIKKENQEIIFNRFRKLEDDNKTLYRGAGLGLSISKHLIDLLGGKIWVNSSTGEGATFIFTIPYKNIDAEINTEIKKLNTQSIDFKKELILVAEDDYSNFRYIEKLLEKANAKILHASNGLEVIEIMEKNPLVKIILMDIKMPEMNGIEAMLELKKRNITIPVIAQTAYAFSNELKQITEAGFVEYIIKPLNPTILYQMLIKYLK